MDSTPSPDPNPTGTNPGDSRVPPRLREGDLLFGRYRLVRELGRGGMGLVLRATDMELGIDVALKLVPDLLIHNETALGDLRREVLRGMALTHPGIVRTHGLVRDEAMAAIVMEYVDGGTFDDLKRLQPGGCYDTADLLPWLEQLSPALDYAHFEIQLAHRDLKPRNLMYTRAGRIKVADFGISSKLEDSMSRVTMSGPSSGTPCYMSPQQVMGERPSHLDDIYALGSTIYELLTGKPPFHQGEVIYQVLERLPPPMNERRAELGIEGKEPIPEHWERLVASCLAKDPAVRPVSAGALVQALAFPEVTVHEPARIARVESSKLRPKRKSGHAFRWGAAVVIAVVVASLVFLFKSTPKPQPTAAPAAPLAASVPEKLPPGVAGEPYLYPFAAVGGKPPYRWELGSGGLPEGMLMETDGRLHGTTFDPDAHTIEWVVTDARGEVSRGRTLLDIAAPSENEVVEETDTEESEPLRIITPLELPSGIVGIPYEFHFAAEGGEPPYRWIVEFGTPPGLTLREDGSLVGTPTRAASGGFVVRLLDGLGTELRSSMALAILPENRSADVAAPLRIKATKEQPFINSLGMKFVPVGSEGVLFCSSLTRVKNFREFVDQAAPLMPGMIVGVEKGGEAKFKRMQKSWKDPGYAQTDDHPVCAVSWMDAMKFCDWLTNKELSDGQLPDGYRYRLPYDKEWRQALALPGDPAAFRFPWGHNAPPNYRCNLAGTEIIKHVEIPRGWKCITGFRDNAPFPSPVEHFPANELGLHDVFGNLWQFCMDEVEDSEDRRLLRGGSWLTYDLNELATSNKFDRITSIRSVDAGFRCVLAPIQTEKP